MQEIEACSLTEAVTTALIDLNKIVHFSFDFAAEESSGHSLLIMHWAGAVLEQFDVMKSSAFDLSVESNLPRLTPFLNCPVGHKKAKRNLFRL